MTTYRRRDAGNGRVEFTLALDAPPPPMSKPALAAGIVVGLIVMSLDLPLALFLGLAAGYFTYRFVSQRMTASMYQVARPTIVVSPEGVRWENGTFVPRADITEILWRDWASGTEEGGHSVYVETKTDSMILQTGFDGPTAKQLASEVAAALGGVGVSGGAPKVTQNLQTPQPGDLILTEVTPGVFDLQEISATGRTHYRDVPAGEVEAMMFAVETAGNRDVWYEKLDSPVAVQLPNPNRSTGV